MFHVCVGVCVRVCELMFVYKIEGSAFALCLIIMALHALSVLMFAVCRPASKKRKHMTANESGSD